MALLTVKDNDFICADWLPVHRLSEKQKNQPEMRLAAEDRQPIAGRKPLAACRHGHGIDHSPNNDVGDDNNSILCYKLIRNIASTIRYDSIKVHSI